MKKFVAKRLLEIIALESDSQWLELDKVIKRLKAESLQAPCVQYLDEHIKNLQDAISNNIQVARNIKELSAIIGVTEMTIKNWNKDGTLKLVKQGKGYKYGFYRLDSLLKQFLYLKSIYG